MKRHIVYIALLGLALVITAPSLPADETHAQSPETTAGPDTGVVAYYFHGTMRCATCKKLEAYSEEAIAQGFADELASGKLTWRAVNTDEPDNKHFVKDFELVTKAVVLVEYCDGTITRWQNIDKIWRLVGDKEDFIDYVRGQTTEFLGEG